MFETLRLIYWTMLFGHRKCSGWFRVKPECRRGYRNPPGELMGHHGTYWRERRATRPGHRAPPLAVRIGEGKGGGAPFPTPSPSPSFPLSSL